MEFLIGATEYVRSKAIMTRIAKAPHERRRELVAAAHQLFHTKGYNSTSVHDIVTAVGVAQGTFYYYFGSKSEILEAVIEALTAQTTELLCEIVADETLAAIPKWGRAVQAINDCKTERKDEMMALARLLQDDGYALLQYKSWTMAIQMVVPELAKIIAQGVEEGVFDACPAEETAGIAFTILQATSAAIVDILLNSEAYERPLEFAWRKIAAGQTAIERVLGAPSGSLPIVDEQAMVAWFAG